MALPDHVTNTQWHTRLARSARPPLGQRYRAGPPDLTAAGTLAVADDRFTQVDRPTQLGLTPG